MPSSVPDATALRARCNTKSQVALAVARTRDFPHFHNRARCDTRSQVTLGGVGQAVNLGPAAMLAQTFWEAPPAASDQPVMWGPIELRSELYGAERRGAPQGTRTSSLDPTYLPLCCYAKEGNV